MHCSRFSLTCAHIGHTDGARYCTLLDCWAEVANNRPSFETLVIFFKAMHEKGEPVAGALTREDMSMWVETTSFGPSGAVAVITPGASGGEDRGVEGACTAPQNTVQRRERMNVKCALLCLYASRCPCASLNDAIFD